VTSQLPTHEIYGLSSQLRRAAVSVSSNIAEGASRSTAVDRKHFFVIARSSLVEIDTQLEICKRLNYISENPTLSEQLNHLFASLSKLIEKT
jgi:four helix bundle protein